MKQLFLLLGVPASGKDTFLENRNLKKYSLSSDDLRELVSNPIPIMTEEGNYEQVANNKSDHKAWELLYQLLEHRMSYGETTFVNATHLFTRAFSRYEVLASKYHYKITVIDVTFDLYQALEFKPKALIDTLVEREQKRLKKFINPELVIEKFANRYFNFLSERKPKFQYELLSISEFDERYLHKGLTPLDFSEYNRIKIIGDVHGDYSNLNKVFADHQKGTAYVFVGDYLDRGTKNAEVFQFLQKLRGKNIFLLRGNHENHIENFVRTGEKTGKDFGSKTLPELLQAGVTSKDLRLFSKKLINALYFEFDGQRYFVSHAGIEMIRLADFKKSKLNFLLANESEFTMGLFKFDEGPYDNNIDESWRDSEINVHGHRNNFHRPIKNGNSYNLTEEGEFRYLDIRKGQGIESVLRKSIDMPSYVEVLKDDEDVIQKVVENDEKYAPILSHNFSREVFNNKRWTPTTMDARGLFTRGEDIIGRGFKKFFNIGENETARLEQLVYPVKIYKKFNGFLAISFWDKMSGEFKIFNKFGVENHWNTLKISRQLVQEHFGMDLNHFYEQEKNRDYSVVFEVMAPTFGDFHIVHYKTDFVEPIAVIHNQTGHFNADFEQDFGIKVLKTVKNQDELESFLEAYNLQNNLEGLVLRDSEDVQLKYKIDFYQIGKILRSSFTKNRFIPNKYQSKAVNQRARVLYQVMKDSGVEQFSPLTYLETYTQED